MANLFVWEEESPLDQDDVNEGALRIREVKKGIRERMNRDHIIGGAEHTSPTADAAGGADSNDSGFHRRITMTENGADSDQSLTVFNRVNTLNALPKDRFVSEIWLQSYARTGGTDQYIMYKGSNNVNKEVTTNTQLQTLTNKTLTSPVVNTPEVVGGTVDNTIIGASTAVAATFTDLTSNDNTVLGSAVSDTVTLNAKVQGNAGTGAGSMQAGITGEIKMYGGIAAPAGWLVCDGASYAESTYLALFAVIAAKYGSIGEGAFSVPDLRGRVPVGANHASIGAGVIARADDINGGVTATATSRDLGVSGGKEKHTLTGAESGTSVHTHANDNPTHTHVYKGVAGGERQAHSTGGGTEYGSGILTDRTTDPTAPGITITATVAASASTSHTNEQPYVTVNFIIKT